MKTTEFELIRVRKDLDAVEWRHKKFPMTVIVYLGRGRGDGAVPCFDENFVNREVKAHLSWELTKAEDTFVEEAIRLLLS